MTQFASSVSLYRREKAPLIAELSGHLVSPSLHAEAHEASVVLPGGTLAVFVGHFIGGIIMLLDVGYVKFTLAADASRRAMLSADVRSSLLLEAFRNAKSRRGAQTRIYIVDRLASSPNNTSRTEARCLDFFESSSTRGETGCHASQIEVTIYGGQLSVTVSMRRVTPSPA